MTKSRSTSGSRVIAATAALILSAAALSGCAQTTATTTGFVSQTELNALYQQEVATFPWDLPTGVKFPSAVPVKDNGGLWESNNARAKAYFYWQCAWVEEFFSVRESDPATAALALDQLGVAAIDDEYLKPFLEDPERGWLRVLEKADLGDSTDLKGYFDASCTG